MRAMSERNCPSGLNSTDRVIREDLSAERKGEREREREMRGDDRAISARNARSTANAAAKMGEFAHTWPVLA